MERCESYKNCCCGELESIIRGYTDYFKHKCCERNNPKSKYNGEYHEFVPSYDIKKLINSLKDIRNYIALRDRVDLLNCERKLKFLDVGCGVGNIMLAAKVCNFIVHGLEYNTTVHRICKEVLNCDCWSSPAKVIKGDMLTFKSYHKYDVIYYYVPINNQEMMKTFTDRLALKMKVGAIVFFCGGPSGSFKTENFKHILDGGIFEKINEGGGRMK